MSMRDYKSLDDIEISKEQEAIMDIFCDSWDGCRESNCTECQDRQKKRISVMECTALRKGHVVFVSVFTPARVGIQGWCACTSVVCHGPNTCRIGVSHGSSVPGLRLRADGTRLNGAPCRCPRSV